MTTSERSKGREFWNEQARTYANSWKTRGKGAMSERELSLLTRYAPQTRAANALDVGIGIGRILNHYVTATPVQRVFGIDAAEEMVRTCRERFADEPRVAGLAISDLTAPLPFRTTFDVITAIRVLKYDAGWTDAVARLGAQLSHGGVLIFSMPNSRSLNRFSRPYGVPWHSTTLEDLIGACHAAGLEPLESHGATRLSYGLYERSDNAILGGLLRGTDVMLDRVLGPTAFVREIFIAARRP
jgi:SAM-dependent methyltransferase